MMSLAAPGFLTTPKTVAKSCKIWGSEGGSESDFYSSSLSEPRRAFQTQSSSLAFSTRSSNVSTVNLPWISRIWRITCWRLLVAWSTATEKRKKNKTKHRSLGRGASFSQTLCFGREEKGTGLMTLDFWSNLCCLCSPRNTSIPVFVYSALKRAPDQMSPSELWVLEGTSTFMGSFFPPVFLLPQNTHSWDSVLRSEAFDAISDLLNLLLKWHSHFCSPPQPRISPLDTTFWSISCRVTKGPRKLTVPCAAIHGSSRESKARLTPVPWQQRENLWPLKRLRDRRAKFKCCCRKFKTWLKLRLKLLWGGFHLRCLWTGSLAWAGAQVRLHPEAVELHSTDSQAISERRDKPTLTSVDETQESQPGVSLATKWQVSANIAQARLTRRTSRPPTKPPAAAVTPHQPAGVWQLPSLHIHREPIKSEESISGTNATYVISF